MRQKNFVSVILKLETLNFSLQRLLFFSRNIQFWSLNALLFGLIKFQRKIMMPVKQTFLSSPHAIFSCFFVSVRIINYYYHLWLNEGFSDITTAWNYMVLFWGLICNLSFYLIDLSFTMIKTPPRHSKRIIYLITLVCKL